MNKRVTILFIVFITAFIGCKNNHSFNSDDIGEPIDSLNNVLVYYNGNMSHVSGRNVTTDGYNLGLKYQCVEFVKRYFYEYLHHKMPNSYGHAKDFFNNSIKDGAINKQRNLTQYKNPSSSKPRVNDLVVFSGTTFNKFGHVAIISEATENSIEVIQQNVGAKTRASFKLKKNGVKWRIESEQGLGWLRKE